jgi:GT2 family glycosyltransferase
MMDSAPRVTISIINWNSADETLQCLEAVEQLSYRPLRLIVIDNGSEDDSVERLQQWAAAGGGVGATRSEPVPPTKQAHPTAGHCRVLVYPNVTLLLADDNYGFCGGNNLSLTYALSAEAPPDYVFLHNNDARPQPDMITRCVEAGRAAHAGIIGAVVKDPETNAVQFAGARFPRELFFGGRLSDPEGRPPYYLVDRVEGAGIMIRRDVLEARLADLGHYLDEKLFIYCDEMELGAWAGRRGYKTVMARDAVMHHAVSVSFGGKQRPGPTYYFTRNKMYVARLWADPLTRAAFTVWYAPAMLLRSAQRLLQRRPDLAEATFVGMLHGLAGITGKRP